MEYDDFRLTVRFDEFSTEPFAKIVPKPWGEELHLAPEGEPYMMKILRINAGRKISLQVHDEKTETWILLTGEATLQLENSDGALVDVVMRPGIGYTSRIGQRHRLIGVSDCTIAEASTRETGTTYRIEDDYSRPNETEALRSQPNRGWFTPR